MREEIGSGDLVCGDLVVERKDVLQEKSEEESVKFV